MKINLYILLDRSIYGNDENGSFERDILNKFNNIEIL